MRENINNWNESVVQRAIKEWGNSYPKYLLSAYQYACKHGNNYLDIGCGFGRFLNHLMQYKEETYNYIGYDSSKAMLEKIRKKINSDNHAIVYLKDITKPFEHTADFIMCSAVLIHLSPDDQIKVLQNIANAKPKHTIFDFNVERRKNNIERTISLSNKPFRMTWNNKTWCISQVKKVFNESAIESREYPIRENKYKLFFYINLK